MVDAQAAAEATADVVETAIESVEAVPVVAKNNPVVLIGVAVVSAAVGAGVATVISKRYFKSKYEAMMEEEIQKAKVFYRKRFKDGEYSDPTVLAEQYQEGEEDATEETAQIVDIQESVTIMKQNGYTPYDKPSEGVTVEEKIEVQESIKKNIFENHEPHERQIVDRASEEAKKRNGEPYIVTEEQYFQNDPEYAQAQFTYFQGDDTLADDEDKIIPDRRTYIGDGNLQFGVGTNEANMVYIWNDRLDTGYEVTRSYGEYRTEVAGLGDEDDRPQLRKFRSSDG